MKKAPRHRLETRRPSTRNGQRAMRKLFFTLALIVMTAAGCTFPSDPPAGKVVVTTSAKPAAKAAPKVLGYGQGTYLVGADIQAGTYQTRGGQFCYWERQGDGDGELTSIIANDVSPGPAVVTIGADDWAFKTSGCAPWTRAAR